MTESYFDDQDLTAYVLGELPTDERAKFEQRLQTDPQLQAAVDELRELTGVIADELKSEPADRLSADQRAEITAAESAAVASASAQSASAQAATAKVDTVLSDSPGQKQFPSRSKTGRGVAAVVLATVTLVTAGILLQGDPKKPTVQSNLVAALDDSERKPSDANPDLSLPMFVKLGAATSNPVAPGRDELIAEAYKKRGGEKVWPETESLSEPMNSVATDPVDALFNQPIVAIQSVAGVSGPSTRGLVLDSFSDVPESADRVSVSATPVAAVQKESKNVGLSVQTQPRSLVTDFSIISGDSPSTPSSDSTGRFRGVRANVSRKRVAAQQSAQPVHPNDSLGLELEFQAPAVRYTQEQIQLARKLKRSGMPVTDYRFVPAPAKQLFADVSGESYASLVENPFIRPAGTQALSTFSIDVDTASYSNMRRFVDRNQWPPADSVRIEELINYFDYGYAAPAGGEPFSLHVESNPCPWNVEHQLVQIGLQGRRIPKADRPAINLVFLVDVSGSMKDRNKLPLVKSALQMLVAEMTEDDRIAIVTYASGAGVQLESTCGSERDLIMEKIHGLSAGGSTNGEAGIQMAYDTALQNFSKDGDNRVILCTDGDFNVGVSSDSALVTMIEEKARSDVFLSIFGFGMGNLKDSKLEGLADKGNGHYAYIDGLKEAKKVFVEEMTGTLFTIAKDVKIQVEFNPSHVGEYRLIGYENRLMAARDFADDTKDAGEIGAGHRVTALYEVVPVDVAAAAATKKDADVAAKLRYQAKQTKPAEQADPDAVAAVVDGKPSPELLTVSLRYKQPTGDKSLLIERPVDAQETTASSSPSPGFSWAAAVASFGMVLRESQYKGNATLELAAELAHQSTLPDPHGHRHEFAELIQKARVIHARRTGQTLDPYIPMLSEKDALKKAAVSGKYSKLLKTVPAKQDLAEYGAFKDFGKWDGTAYSGANDLPPGYWVYVYPSWYIWESTTEQASTETTATPVATPAPAATKVK